MTAIDFPIVDPHVHLWDPRTTPRAASPLVRTLGWWPKLAHRVATAVLPAPVRGFLGRPDYILAPHLPADHAAGLSGHMPPLRIDTVVHVEAGWEAFGALGPAGETQWLETLDYAGAGMRLGAIVAHADLRSARLPELLTAHRAASPRLRGIRHKASRHPSTKVMSWTRVDRLYQDTAFLRGFEQLAALGLSFDAWCYSTQLRDVAALAARFPEVTIVLDHLGTPVGAAGPVADVGATPEERARIVGSWRDDLARVAEHSNVVAKLSGLTMPVVGFDFHTRAVEPSASELVERLGPFIRHALDRFGVSRCCFASNFPMDKVSASSARLFEAYAQLAAERGAAAPRALLRDNALRFYRV